MVWSNDGDMYNGHTSVLPPKVVFIYKITRSYRFLEKQYCFARCFCIVKNFIQLSEVNRDDSETAMFTIMNVIKGIKMNEQTLRATMG